MREAKSELEKKSCSSNPQKIRVICKNLFSRRFFFVRNLLVAAVRLTWAAQVFVPVQEGDDALRRALVGPQVADAGPQLRMQLCSLRVVAEHDLPARRPQAAQAEGRVLWGGGQANYYWLFDFFNTLHQKQITFYFIIQNDDAG